MNRLRMFGVVKMYKDEVVTCTTWPKATLMRKVGFIDRTTGSLYPTEGVIQAVGAKTMSVCLLNNTTEPIRVGDLVVMKSGTELGTAATEKIMPPYGFK